MASGLGRYQAIASGKDAKPLAPSLSPQAEANPALLHALVSEHGDFFPHE